VPSGSHPGGRASTSAGVRRLRPEADAPPERSPYRGTVPRRPPLVDVGAAAGLAVALVLVSPHLPTDGAQRAVEGGGLVLVAAAALALAFRRVAPRAVLAATAAAVVVYALADYRGGPMYLVPLVAMGTVAEVEGRRRAAGPAALATAAIAVAGLIAHGDGLRGLIEAVYVSWAVGAVLVGDAVRARRLSVVALEERARALEAGREEEARRRVAEERVRIARDVHDVVAHSLASISIQAGMGAHLIDRRPEDARAALEAIKQASREALTELRATLDVLRDPGAAPRTPTPAAGLAQLPALLAPVEQAGVPVLVRETGEGPPLHPAVDATAYRIVQESLTNVMRHAGPCRVEVLVTHSSAELRLDVVDDGTVAGPTAMAADGPGHGLTGMGERAALIGGRVTAGPRGDGSGFRVHAVLPRSVPPLAPGSHDATDPVAGAVPS
jgi:signal transduction histidine kinase